ncbi:hypothetical protein GCM10022255_040200 [Dactylosporangium darangshiense]|uniref:Uncharacterized protein n=1 Tax=Dactylosporangium darangshiense TaxID=579108 RepID=A0ABP8DA71_9ACTN
MESAVLSSDVNDQPVTVEPEDAPEELFWLPTEARPASAGPHTDERFIL